MSKKSSTQTPPKSFEAAVEEIESIVESMDVDEASLDASITRYERGMFLLQYCRAALADAESRIERLSMGADGALKASPMQTENVSDE
jgi:exodeoxyribonuclease VII small subunit